MIIFDLLSSDLKIGTAYANFPFHRANPSLLGKNTSSGRPGLGRPLFFKAGKIPCLHSLGHLNPFILNDAGKFSIMKLSKGQHLAYCTNVHRGNNWEETFFSLEQYVLKVRKKICPDTPYAIGLRLGADAARELSNPEVLNRFREWLDLQNAYIFTINGFPYGNFHGQRVKEKVYLPDWTDPKRLTYTLSLFQVLSALLPAGMEGSVSTLPASFKEFHPADRLPDSAYKNLLTCAEEIEHLSLENDLDLHLGMEPEPLGWFETTVETLRFLEELFDRAKDPEMVRRRIGVNYDCCHLAIEREDAREGLDAIKQAGVRLSKLHLSSALQVIPTPQNLQKLTTFVEPVYLHQVITSQKGRVLERIKDLDRALQCSNEGSLIAGADEWRVHFHVPLHASPGNGLRDTRQHVLDTLDWLQENPDTCRHLEMETYTWEVLPPELRSSEVVDQVAKEYEWTLNELNKRGLK